MTRKSTRSLKEERNRKISGVNDLISVLAAWSQITLTRLTCACATATTKKPEENSCPEPESDEEDENQGPPINLEEMFEILQKRKDDNQYTEVKMNNRTNS